MNFFLLVILCTLIVSLHADFNITRRVPNATVAVRTQQFMIEINQPVNQPSFSSFIYICNATLNTSIYQIDVHNTSSNVTYLNNTLTFYLPQYLYNMTHEFSITFDAGVLFSNSTTNSSARIDSQFWYLKVIDMETTTGITNLFLNTSMATTYNGMTDSTVTHGVTSAAPVTTMAGSYTSMKQTTQNSASTTSANVKTNAGESSPTRSAQLGMGLGITFITVLIVGEIIYFKYCYSHAGRTGSYYT